MAEPEQIISDEIEALPAEETIELDLEREKHRKRSAFICSMHIF